MKKENKQPDEEYRPDVNRGTACMLTAIAAALIGDTALYFNWWAVGMLCYVVLLICVVWLVKSRKDKDRSDYKQYKKLREAISQLKAEQEKIITNLDLKADKPAKSNIHPGSRPSDQYKMLIGGEVLDRRAED